MLLKFLGQGAGLPKHHSSSAENFARHCLANVLVSDVVCLAEAHLKA